MDLFDNIQELMNELNISIKALRKTTSEYADAYINYRIKLATKLVELRDEGMPVTIAYDVARGQSDIARLKRNEIIKEGIHLANQEAINSLKLQIRILEGQLQREWSNTK
jgi:hypothetical protein